MNPYYPLQELIKLVHINIREELASEIAERQADTCSAFCAETVNDFAQKPQRITVFDSPVQDVLQNFMVDAREKLSDIAFQNPCRPHMVPGNNPRALSEAVHGAVRTFVVATGI